MRRRLVLPGGALLLVTTVVVLRLFGPWANELRPAPIPEPQPYTRNATSFPDDREGSVVLDEDGRQIIRRNGAGRILWTTRLKEDFGVACGSCLVTDAARAYVSHGDGVTAVDAQSGAIVWDSPGFADCLLVSGDLLLATESKTAELVAKAGRWFLGRSTRTGREVFRVALPVEPFYGQSLIEAAGLFVVQKSEPPDGTGLALLVDRTGQIHHQFDRQVVALVAGGKGRVVLTSRDVVGLSAGGKVLWVIPFQREWTAGGGLISLPGGDLIAFLYCEIANSGVQILRLNPATGRKVWEAICDPMSDEMPIITSDFQNVVVVLESDRVKVTSRVGAGTFVEALNTETGEQIGRREIRN